MIKVAINGFGRIGRHTFKHLLEYHQEKIEVVAINDLGDPKTLAHLLKYDSLYGIYKKNVKAEEGLLVVEGKKIPVFCEKDPAKLPWKNLELDIVLECTGVFRFYEGAKKHLEAGAKKVIISAPAKDDKIPSFILGVNANEFDPEKYDIIDMGSCTTNCLAPICKVLDENFKIIKGFMSTIHSYTNDQRILDLPHKDLRRARAAALSIIPTTTGAAKAIGKVLPHLKGKLDGIAFRVPTPSVSVLDFVCLVEKETQKEEVNYIFKKASQEDSLKNILGLEDAPLVSCDYRGNLFSAIVDANLTNVIGNLVKVVAFYDNEWAYAKRLAEMAEFVGERICKE